MADARRRLPVPVRSVCEARQHLKRGRIIRAVGYVDGLDLYAYVANNPLAYVDPGGTKLRSALGSFGSSFGSSFDSSFGSSFARVYDYGKTSLSGFRHEVGL